MEQRAWFPFYYYFITNEFDGIRLRQAKNKGLYAEATRIRELYAPKIVQMMSFVDLQTGSN